MKTKITTLTLGLAASAIAAPAFAQDLTLWIWRQEDRAVYEDLIATFEAAHPGITVEFEAFEASSYAPILSTALASGSGPDLMMVRAYGAVEAVAGAGYLMPITQDDVPGLAGMNQTALTVQTLRADNTMYGVPFASQIEAGAQIVVLDCTERARTGGARWQDVLDAVLEAGCEGFADVSTLEEGRRVAEAGATNVATTLSGYVDPATPPPEGPDCALIEALVAFVPAPVIAEGRIATPAQAAQAHACGAHAVVVGEMITNPRAIAQGFVRALSRQVVAG